MTKIDYYFTLLSPYAYLGHGEIRAVSAQHNAELAVKPVGLMAVWEQSGSVPLGKRPKARQDSRLIELQRWREKRGVPLNLHPKHFPTNPTLADRSVIAVIESGSDPCDYMGDVFQALWAQDKDISDPEVLAEILAANGFQAAAILETAQSEAIADIHQNNTEEAIQYEVIGSPCYVLNGEPFWGQDQIGLLDDALTKQREPYTAE